MPEYRLLAEHSVDKVKHPSGTVLTLPQQLGDDLVREGKAISTTSKATAIPKPPVLKQSLSPFLTPAARGWGCCGKRK